MTAPFRWVKIFLSVFIFYQKMQYFYTLFSPLYENNNEIIRANEGNLKDISLVIPKNKLAVFTGTPKEMTETGKSITADYL